MNMMDDMGFGYNGHIMENAQLRDWETEGGYSAKVKGNVGELILSSILGSLPAYYHVLDNILLKTKKGSTQIDHVIVSPFGIFVVETKNYKGMMFGDMQGMVWTQVLPRRGHFRVYNPVRQNQGHLENLSKQTKIPLNYMCGVIVFTDPTVNLSNVNCPICFRVDEVYEFINSFNVKLFNNRQIHEIIQRIDKVNIDSYINRQKHIDYVNSIKQRRGY